ncbi:hypothetical protein [Streptomyces mirabilis]|uniref:hypothetical protein n=1 Tax=Streptomyces mirabilis TaxID=68239 RepID=UPI00369FFDCE
MQEQSPSPDPRLRDEIRRDLIEWWRLAHPDAEPPETVREIISLWFDEKKEAMRGLPEKRAERLRQDARIHAFRINELKVLEPEDSDVTMEVVRAAHWTDNSRASWSLVVRDLMDDHPSLFFPVAFALFMVSLNATLPYLYSRDDFETIGGRGMAASAIFLTVLLLIHGRILAVLRRMNANLPQFWRISVAGGGIALLVEGSWLAVLREQALRQKPYVSRSVYRVLEHADLCAAYALKWFLTCVLVAFAFSAGGSLLHRIGPKEPAHAVATSRLILELMNLALWSQAALDRLLMNPPSEGLRPYVASDERESIIRSLDLIARMAEGRWKRSLKVGDSISDSAVAALSEGIAASARKWKAVAATGGERLDEMNEAFARALVDASKGNWELLASEVSSRELLRRRLLRMVRRLFALAVMLVSASMVLVDPFNLLGKDSNPAIGSLLLTFAAILSVSIDPTIVERLGNASKMASNFSSKK